MDAVFQPARIRRRAAEVNPLCRIEDVVNGELLFLGQDNASLEQNCRQDKKSERTFT